MERSGDDRLDFDAAEETTRPGSEWPVPEPYLIGARASTPTAEPETAVVATAAPPRRFPLGRASVPLAAALVLAAIIAPIPFLASPSEPSSEAGAAQRGARPPSGGTAATAPRSPAPVVQESHGSAGIEVPDVEGASVVAARRALRKAELEVETRAGESDHAEGVVLEQVPGPGERVVSGSTVVLVVSSGPSGIVVPDVVGLRADRAGRLVRREGLRVEVRLVRSSERAGVVVAQRPSGGETLHGGGVVQLSVAKSSPEVASVRVPRLEGLTLDQATARLSARGLRWSAAEVPSNRAPGVVVGQSDRAGAVVEKGTRVALEVSSGPKLHAVPDVVGLDVVHAREQLEAAGFQVLVAESSTTDLAEDGIVLDQSPGGGTRLSEGSEVTIYVGMAG